MRFIGCSEKEVYGRSLESTVRSVLDLDDTSNTVHSLDYVPMFRSYDTFYLLINFENCLKDILFAQRYQVIKGMALFVFRQCVDIF